METTPEKVEEFQKDLYRKQSYQGKERRVYSSFNEEDDHTPKLKRSAQTNPKLAMPTLPTLPFMKTQSAAVIDYRYKSKNIQ